MHHVTFFSVNGSLLQNWFNQSEEKQFQNNFKVDFFRNIFTALFFDFQGLIDESGYKFSNLKFILLIHNIKKYASCSKPFNVNF